MGALNFEERDARAVLLPLERMETVRADATPEDVEAVAARTGYSRFPVRDDGRLGGYVHVKDALESDPLRRRRPINPARIRPLPTVLETEKLRSVLSAMQRSGAHLAGVASVDDSRLLGVVALEDVLEELVGEIRDEAGAIGRTRRRRSP